VMRLILIYRHYIKDLDKLRRSIYKILKDVDGITRIIIRLDYIHVEVDITLEDRLDKQKLDKINEKLNMLNLEFREMKIVNGISTEKWRDRLLKYIEEGRYWEAHELLEDIWKESGNENFRYIILFLIPFLKAQLGQFHRIPRAVERFLDSPDIEFIGINIKCLKKLVRELFIGGYEGFLYPPDIKKCVK